MVYISGSISYIYIKKNNIKLLLLLDDHQNTNYCKKRNICIDKFLNKCIYLSKYNIFVEEPLNFQYENTQLIWTSPHTKKYSCSVLSGNDVAVAVSVGVVIKCDDSRLVLLLSNNSVVDAKT